MRMWYHVVTSLWRCVHGAAIPVKLPWIFPGAPLNFNGAHGNIQGNSTGMDIRWCVHANRRRVSHWYTHGFVAICWKLHWGLVQSYDRLISTISYTGKLVSWHIYMESWPLFRRRLTGIGICRNPHDKPKTVWRPPQVYNGNPLIRRRFLSE